MKRYLAPSLLLVSVLLVGWTFLVDNFFGKPLDATTFQNPSNNDTVLYSTSTRTWSTGSVASLVPDASTTTKGLTKLDTAPAVASNPIAVGSNSAVLNPAPSGAGKVPIDTGTGYHAVGPGAANTLWHGNGAADPTFSKLVDADVTALTLTGGSMAANTVTLGKIAVASANSKLLGSGASGSGSSYSELTLGTGLSMSGTTLNAAAGSITIQSGGSNVDTAMATINFNGTNFAVTNTGSTQDLVAIATSGVTNSCLAANSVDNSKVAAGAAIAYSKLNLASSIVSADIVDGTLVNADVNAAAAIAYSKLNLASSIVSADIVDGTIVNADVNASAAIAYSKLNLASSIVTGDIVDGTIATADLGNAQVTLGKIANAAASSRLLGSGSSGSSSSYSELTVAGLLSMGSSSLTGQGPTVAENSNSYSDVRTINVYGFGDWSSSNSSTTFNLTPTVGALAYSNLIVALATTNTSVTCTADALQLTNAANELMVLRSVNVTGGLATTWLSATNGGLDSGSAAIDTWYSIWVIAKQDGATSSLLSTSATSPTMPSGYTFKRRVGWARSKHATATQPIDFIQYGNVFHWRNDSTAALTSDGGTLITGGGATSFTQVVASDRMPSTARQLRMTTISRCNGAITQAYTFVRESTKANQLIYASYVVGPSAAAQGESFLDMTVSTTQCFDYQTLTNALFYAYAVGYEDQL